jgi:hypothetical protein
VFWLEPKSLRLQPKHLATGAKKSATEGKTEAFEDGFMPNLAGWSTKKTDSQRKRKKNWEVKGKLCTFASSTRIISNYGYIHQYW